MRRVSLGKAENTQDGDHTVRPVSYLDLLAVALVPFSFTSFATTDRRLCWGAGAIPVASLVLMLMLQLCLRLFLDKSLHLEVPGVLLNILFGAHIIQIPIALYAWYQAYTSKLNHVKLPRKVLHQDYLLALLCPPAAIALHKTSRGIWMLVSFCWLGGLLQGFLRSLHKLDENKLDLTQELGQGAIIHVFSVITAEMVCVMADKVYKETYISNEKLASAKV